MLHRLERADRDAVLPPFGRVGDADVEHAAHEPDQIGAREREPQSRPRVEILARERPTPIGDPRPGTPDTAVPARIARILRVRSAPSFARSTRTRARR